MKKLRIIHAVLIGILIGGGFLLAQYLFCLHNWKYDYKGQVFSTFSEYFFSVSTGAFLIAAFFGLLPVGIWILNYFMEKPQDGGKKA